MEAFAMGRPVVTTHVAGIPELVVNGESGWLVPPAAPDALRQAVLELLAAPTVRLERMAECGLARVRRDHDVLRNAEQLVELFTESRG
jgi:glycosyltransferase involved in cell wall biosynthesis